MVVVENVLNEVAVPLPYGAYQQEDMVWWEANQEDDNGAGHQILDASFLDSLRACTLAHCSENSKVRHGEDS